MRSLIDLWTLGRRIGWTRREILSCWVRATRRSRRLARADRRYDGVPIEATPIDVLRRRHQ